MSAWVSENRQGKLGLDGEQDEAGEVDLKASGWLSESRQGKLGLDRKRMVEQE